GGSGGRAKDLLTAIGQKAKTKATQKKARSLLKAQERPAEPVAAAGPSYGDADQKRANELAARMSALASTHDPAGLREAYAATRVAWVELLADADIRPDIVEAFEDRSSTVRDRLAAEEAARAEAERQRQVVEREQSARVEVGEQVEKLSGDGIQDRVAQARATWEGMPGMPDAWGPSLEHRFQE